MEANEARRRIPILMADDDPDDRMLAQDALDEVRLANDLYFVQDGEELLDFLHRRGAYENADPPRPGLILLDLKMPKKDGFEALQEIKEDADLRSIPVVILTTSRADEDVVRGYDLGVSGYVTKPVTFDGLVRVMQAIERYWFEIVELPGREP